MLISQFVVEKHPHWQKIFWIKFTLKIKKEPFHEEKPPVIYTKYKNVKTANISWLCENENVC